MRLLILLIFKISLIYAYIIQLDNKCFKEYYDTDKKIPIYAEYILTKEEVEKPNPVRLRYFPQDKRIPKEYRSKHSDYTKQYCLPNERCDRGHQVGNDIVDYDKECQKYSFLMSNITPQTRYFNRSIWKKYENLEKEYAIKYGKIIVLEGNFGSYGKLPKGENIPKYFFKIFLTKNKIFYIIIDQDGKKYPFEKLKEFPFYRRIQNVIRKNQITVPK